MAVEKSKKKLKGKKPGSAEFNKAKIELTNAHAELANRYQHFMESHSDFMQEHLEFMKIVSKLEDLK